MKKYLWIAALAVAADRLTKAWARTLSGPVTLIPGVLGLRCCENTGIAFSMLSGLPWLVGLLSLAVVAAGWLLLRQYRMGGLPSVSAMLILGGAAGNAIDRLAAGSVTDMIEVLLFRFAVFNVADVCVCAGCALMALSLLVCPAAWERRS